jgi:hypothetical protein
MAMLALGVIILIISVISAWYYATAFLAISSEVLRVGLIEPWTVAGNMRIGLVRNRNLTEILAFYA